MFRSLLALVFVLTVTELPLHASPLAQPDQGISVRAVQSSTGALFLTSGPSAWPLVPDQMTDADRTLITVEQDEIEGTFKVGQLLFPPTPQVSPKRRARRQPAIWRKSCGACPCSRCS